MAAFNERRKNGNDVGALLVNPGEITLVREETMLMAITGRSVAVCIWDSREKIGAMSHFVLPAIREQGKTTARYGNVAILTLVRMMEQAAPEGLLEAHVLGGAVNDATDTVGAENCDVARRILAAKRIHLASEDVGGSKGRKILFDTSTGHVAVLKVHQVRKEDWGEKGENPLSLVKQQETS